MLSIFAYELRLLSEITCTPKIKREQRRLRGAHGMAFAAGVIDSCAGPLFAPNAVSASPLGDPRKRDVNLFGDVPMRRVFYCWPKQQETHRQRFARNRPSEANQFGPAIRSRNAVFASAAE